MKLISVFFIYNKNYVEVEPHIHAYATFFFLLKSNIFNISSTMDFTKNDNFICFNYLRKIRYDDKSYTKSKSDI